MKYVFAGVIVPASIIIPVAVAIARWRQWKGAFTSIFLYLCFSLAANIASRIMAGHGINNMPLLHVDTIVEMLLFGLFYVKLFRRRKQRQLIRISLALFCLFNLVNFIFIQSIYQFNTYPRPIEAILMISFSLICWWQPEAEERINERWADIPENWIISGILFYFSSAMFLFIFSNYLIHQFSKQANIFIWNLHAAMVMLMYLLFTLGFYKCEKKRKMQDAEIRHQKALLESVISSQETERKRIGMDLHDEVGAALSTLRIKIEKEAAESSSIIFFRQCKTEIDKIIDNMRSISHHLSPHINGNFGFYDAVHELADNINKTGKITMQVLFDENKMPPFANEQSVMALYRVIAELVNNTLKHASATRILLTIDIKDKKMALLYQDDGKGIQPDETGRRGMGMHNIESRLSIIGASWELLYPQPRGYGILVSVPADVR
jgi:signal transduction histidine kinase